MKKYSALNLKAIRKATGLHFAHFTFPSNMCSCCYGPTDLPTIYWENKETKQKAIEEKDFNYTYILFKNAPNGSGSVKKESLIEDGTCIMYRFSSKEQQSKVIEMLQEQLGSEYIVIAPEDEYHCIEIKLKK